MNNDLRNLIQEEFGNCNNVSEVCELYAEIRLEVSKQMQYVIEQFVSVGE